jgi:formate/nitrite transporter FocA (FNT family)
LSERLKKWLILLMHIAALPTLFFIVNLLPVTIANIIGGSLMAVMVYWFDYIRKGMVTPATSDAEDQA